MRRLSWLTLGLTAVLAGTAEAQRATGQFTISPGGGAVTFDRASGIEAGGAAAVDAQYAVTSMFSLGTHFMAARSSTRGEDFLAALTFGNPTTGDTTYYFRVSQPVTLINAALSASAQLPFGRFRPFLTGGAGVYSVHLDPQVMRGESHFARMSALVGGGLDIQLTEAAGLRLDVRDLVLFNYDRERLRPTEDRFLPVRRAEDLPVAPEAKETLHNLALMIGFSYTPRRGGSAEGDDQ